LKYIRNAEQQKEMIKKQEKNNELEKDKIKAKEKKPIVIPEEDAQTNFSTVNGQTISALTSGTATPNPLSFPVNYDDLYDTLMRAADLQGENPNTGRVSFATLQSNPLSNLTSSNTSIDSVIPSYIRPDGVDTRFESTRGTGKIAPKTAAIGRLWLDAARQSLANAGSSNSSILSSNITAPSIDDLSNYTQEPALPVGDPEPEEEYIEPEDEFFEPEGEIIEPEIIEPDAQPLVIEPTPPEAVIIPPIQPEAPLLYENEDQITAPRKEESRQAEEQPSIAKTPVIIPFEDVIDKFGIKQLGQILIQNNINSEDGYPFFIKDGHVKTTLFNTNTARLKYYQIDKPELKRYLIEANRNGLINI
jgi:hypothetical protein